MSNYLLGGVAGIIIGILGVGYLLFSQRRQEAAPQRHNVRPNYAYQAAPGENCAVCVLPMNTSNMRSLRCGHAIHIKCYEALSAQGITVCVACGENF